jgi:hypothetical protein
VLKVIDLIEQLTDPVEHAKNKDLRVAQCPIVDVTEALKDLLHHSRVASSLDAALAALGYVKPSDSVRSPTCLPSSPMSSVTPLSCPISPCSAQQPTWCSTPDGQHCTVAELPLISVETELAMHFDVHTTKLKRKKLRKLLALWS